MRRHSRIRDDRGQTMVEFTLVVPLLLVILFGIIQFGIVYNNYITLTDAVRVGARKAAVSRTAAFPADVAKAALLNAADNLDQAKLQGVDGAGNPRISITAPAWQHGADVTVRARYPYEIDLLGWVVASGELQSEMVERLE